MEKMRNKTTEDKILLHIWLAIVHKLDLTISENQNGVDKTLLIKDERNLNTLLQT